jgi:hypothetical protein
MRSNSIAGARSTRFGPIPIPETKGVDSATAMEQINQRLGLATWSSVWQGRNRALAKNGAISVALCWLVAVAATLTRPSVGYADWPYRAQAGPFLVAADAPVEGLDSLAEELLQLSERMQTDLAIPLRIERIRLYLFHDRELFEAFLLQNMPQLTPRDINRQGLFVLRGNTPVIVAMTGPELRRTLRHEFVHAVLNPSLPQLPLWLDEGLAMYYEVPDGSGWQERLADYLAQVARTGWQPDLARLESLTRMQQMGLAEYAEAWSWTFLLMRGGPEYRERLRSYLAELRRGSKPRPLSERWTGSATSPEKSWLVFYGWSPAPTRPRFWSALRQWWNR